MSRDPHAYAQMRVDSAVRDGADCLRHVRRILADAAEKMDGYLVTYDEMKHPDDKAKVLSWVVNYLSTSVLNNCDMAAIMNRAVDIRVAVLEVSLVTMAAEDKGDTCDHD